MAFKTAAQLFTDKQEQLDFHNNDKFVNESVIQFLINESMLQYSTSCCYVRAIHPECVRELLAAGYTIDPPQTTDDFETNGNYKISWAMPDPIF